MVRAGGRERVCLTSVGLHGPEQSGCIAEVVSIFLNVADTSQ